MGVFREKFLNMLKFHIMKKEKRYEQFGYDVNYYMKDERMVMERIEGLFK